MTGMRLIRYDEGHQLQTNRRIGHNCTLFCDVRIHQWSSYAAGRNRIPVTDFASASADRTMRRYLSTKAVAQVFFAGPVGLGALGAPKNDLVIGTSGCRCRDALYLAKLSSSSQHLN